MKATLETESASDERLVLSSRNGDREAFARIVERYQSLICALTYGACGDLQTSEDLAQMTFITAWCELPKLQEPSKLKSWLCGIARNVANSSFRQQRHTPTANAKGLDETADIPSDAPSPRDHVITKEEETILWRALGELPSTYREPLVLFYRQHQSTAEVAEVLGLSEDAVSQRLSRGRTMLTERVAQFVETTLSNTGPTKVFTVGVLASLPLLATTAKAATVAVTATKGSSAAKAATGTGMLSALLTGGMMAIFSLFGLFGFSGRWVGRRMGLAGQQSPRGRERIIQFWRTLAAGFLLLVLLPFLVPRAMIDSHPWLFRAQTWSLAAFYWLVAAALAIWVWRRRRDAHRHDAKTMETPRTSDKSYNLWVTLGMIGPACILGAFLFALFFSDWPLSHRRIPEAEARSIISERKDARFTVYQYKNGSRFLSITLPDHRIDSSTPLDGSLLSALTEKGIAYKTLIEDRDFHTDIAREWLVLLSTFIVVAGTVLLLRRPGTRKFYQQETATPRAESREKKIVAVCAALAMIAMSLLLVCSTIAHAPARTISGAEAGRIISEQKNARFEVFQYDNGSKDLWITLPESRSYPGFITPADEPTLALLAENHISYKTYVQGRDFGFRGPTRWVSLTCSFILMAGAVILLWWVGKKIVAVCAALALIAVVILLGLITRWNVHTISGAEAGRIISEHKNARFEVFQYDNGSKELWITLPESRSYRGFITPADEPTLALLAENHISYKTYVQGRDFGYATPRRWVSLLCIFILTAGAVILLRWAWKNQAASPAPVRT
ncbi:MAG: sigma-70 family RNA polymerase sigma factor [Verrucomicrobiia bacterium]